MRVPARAVAAGLAAGLATVATASSVSLPGEPQIVPLQPLGEWRSLPSATRCTIERPYGDQAKPILLAVHESISGKSFEFNVKSNANGRHRVEEVQAAIYAAGARIERWSLHSVSDRGTDTLSFGLTSPEISRLTAADIVTFRVNGRLDQSFALNGLADALRRLDECTAQLRQDWRVDVPDAPAGIRGPRDDLRTPFARVASSWAQAQLHFRPGNVRFIVLVDENGKVADCDVQETAGAPLLQELGCRLVRETVAEPARDRTGQPVKDSFRTPPIIAD